MESGCHAWGNAGPSAIVTTSNSSALTDSTSNSPATGAPVITGRVQWVTFTGHAGNEESLTRTETAAVELGGI